MLACKQTHEETIERFYKITSFQFDNADRGISWLKKIPETHRKLVTEVKIVVWKTRLDIRDYMRLVLSHRSMVDTEEKELNKVEKKLKRAGIAMAKGVIKFYID